MKTKITDNTFDLNWVKPSKYKLPNTMVTTVCLHDACSQCHGTGRKDNGQICVHMLVCKCPKHGVTSL